MTTMISRLLICAAFLCARRAFCLQTSCDGDEFSADIADSIEDEVKFGARVGVSYDSTRSTSQGSNSTKPCQCKVHPCVRKCCPLGSEVQNKTCVPSETEEANFVQDLGMFTDVPDTFHVVYGFLRCDGRTLLHPSLSEADNIFRVLDNGYLKFEQGRKLYTVTDYCLDYFGAPGLSCLICFGIEDDDTFSYKGMIISMPFLLATFLVYAFLPDRNLPAKALMCYVLSLLFAYILLVTIQLDNGHESTTCIALAFFCYFFFMASFFWMNASCLDIFFTFSGIRGLLGERKKENRRFMYYSAYAWGVPVLLVAFAAFFTFGDIENSNSNFYTGLGNGQCWFRSGWPTGIYFYFPIATLLIINIVLFGITTYKIKKVQRDTKMLKNVDSRKHKYDNNDKQRFNLYVKLLFAMGINWSMEVISWVVLWKLTKVPDYVWILTDFCNAVYGVFIFFIFVFKRNIWMLLKKRYLQLTGRPQQAHTLTSTHRTTVSQVSSSEA